MKIDEAIEVLELLTKTADPWPSKELKEAAKLGIEALERCKYIAEHTDRWSGVLLPGETK